ncbi:unnamed protein product [Gongylonema pulchrum]|uniref:Tyrosine-protein phosphatase domain-containing protein n=1 Tax=Gongylonema pulchrum TaxID=637853 RepID=A0A183DFP8_9BILA|nr:unnamed protein product [Gongylonema pulchrum]
MLCKCEEHGKPKSAQYWPLVEGSYKTYGSMFVNNKRVECKDKFMSYVLEILPDGCSNSIILTLLHMTDWPDRGVPASGRSVLRLLRLIEPVKSLIVFTYFWTPDLKQMRAAI